MNRSIQLDQQQNRDERQNADNGTLGDAISDVLGAIVLHSTASIWIANKDGTLVFENDANRELFGINSDDQIIGRYNIFDDEELSGCDHASEIRRIFDQGGTAEFCLHYTFSHIKDLTHADPDPKTLNISMYSMNDGVGHVAIQNQVWAEKRPGASLNPSSMEQINPDRRQQFLFENNPLPMWIYDLKTLAFLAVNDAAVEHYGYSREEFATMTINDILPTDTIPGTKSGQGRHVKKDGSVIDVDIISHPIEYGERSAEIVIANDITKRLQIENELREAEEKYRSLVEKSLMGVYIMQEGRFVYVNPRFAEILGYTPDEITSGELTPETLAAPEDRELVAANIRKRISGEITSIRYSFKTLRKDGSTIDAEVLGSVIMYHGRPALIGSMVDITEQKRAEKELQERSHELEILLNISRQLNSELDIPVIMRNLVASAMELTGAHSGAAGIMTQGELVFSEYNEAGNLQPINFSFPEGYGVPGHVMATKQTYVSDDAEHDPYVVPEIRTALNFYNLIDTPIISRSGELVGCFEIHDKKDHQPFNERDAAVLQGLADSAASAIENAKAVNDLKQTEAALIEERNIAQQYLNVASVIILAIDKNQTVTMINPKGCEVLGYPADQIIGKNWFDNFIPMVFRDESRDTFSRLMAGDIDSTEYFETPVLIPSGGERLIAWHNAALFDDRGNVTATLSSGEDITDRRKAEGALKDSEQRLYDIINFLPDATYAIDMEGKVIIWNKAMEEVTGIKPEDIIGKDNYEHAMPFYGKRRAGLADMVIHPEAMHEESYRLFKKEKDTLIAEAYAPALTPEGAFIWAKATPLYSHGEIVGAIESVRDITDRKMAEAALIKERNLAQQYLAVASVIIFVIDQNQTLTMINHKGTEVLGYPADQIIGKNFFDNFIPLRFRDAARGVNRRLMAGELENTEGPVLTSNGEERLIAWRHALLYDDRGNVTDILSSGEDITDRKKAEDALKDSEQRLSDIINFLPDATYAIDMEGKVIIWNKAMEAVSGIKPEDIIGKGNYEYAVPFYGERRPILSDMIIHPETMREEVYSLFKKEKDTLIGEAYVPALTPEGAYIWAKATPLYSHGEMVGAIESVRDVTDRIRAVQALRKSEEKFRSIFENSELGIFQSTLDGKLIIANQAYAHMFGYDSPEEIIEAIKDLAKDLYLHSESRDEVIRTIMQSGGIAKFENQYRRKDGSIMTGSLTLRAVRDDKGKVLYLEGFVEDITARKDAEARNQELEAHKREFYRRTILAATEGKLIIAEHGEIMDIAGPSIKEWNIKTAVDVGETRNGVSDISHEYGMDESRIYDFILCIGESTTNAIKHAGGGLASLHKVEDCLMFVIEDHGKGIEALTLPEVALVRGYSTAKSLGMGYKAMISIADRVYLATGPTGTTVGIQMKLGTETKQPSFEALPDTW